MELVPQDLSDLLARMYAESRINEAVFALPRKKWYLPAAGGPELLELGYWRRSGYAGLGYGREAVLGLMRWCLAQLGVGRFRIRCDEANAASRHLAEALGFSSVHVYEEDFYGVPRRQHLYEREVLR